MEKKSVISAPQLIVLLIMTRLPYSTAYFVSLGASRNIQDILFAVPVNFVLNFIVAIPILLLLKRYPGKDLIECASLTLGKAAGVVIALFYMLCFLSLAIYINTMFEEYFGNVIIPEAGYIAIAIPLLVVAFYGAAKGIESIARFGSVVIVAYVVIVTIIFLSVIPNIDMDYLKPIFYNGPSVFIKAVLSGINSNMQILFLAFCAPFLKEGTKPGKIFAKWNIIASLMFLVLEFVIIIVMGPFAAKQNYPISTLAMQSKVGVFERIDAFDMIAWILETLLMVTFFVYLSVGCVLKVGFNKHRKWIAFFVVAAVFAIAPFFKKHFIYLHAITLSPMVTIITMLAIILIPLLVLTADIIKRRASANE